jgi:hypothetical protein
MNVIWLEVRPERGPVLHPLRDPRIYAGEIEILDPSGAVLRRHARVAGKGRFVLEEDRPAVGVSVRRR